MQNTSQGSRDEHPQQSTAQNVEGVVHTDVDT